MKIHLVPGHRNYCTLTLPQGAGLLITLLVVLSAVQVREAVPQFKDTIQQVFAGRARRHVAGLTVEGTLWCGPGDNAGGDREQLGVRREADSCCRAHDTCSPKVKALRRKYHYWNWRPYTVTHCQCDRTFRNCLYSANTSTADQVGDWFFNRFDVACFDLVFQRVCVDRSWWGGCLHWEMDNVAHITSAGPYVWWLKDRPPVESYTPLPDTETGGTDTQPKGTDTETGRTDTQPPDTDTQPGGDGTGGDGTGGDGTGGDGTGGDGTGDNGRLVVPGIGRTAGPNDPDGDLRVADVTVAEGVAVTEGVAVDEGGRVADGGDVADVGDVADILVTGSAATHSVMDNVSDDDVDNTIHEIPDDDVTNYVVEGHAETNVIDYPDVNMDTRTFTPETYKGV